MTTDQGAIYVTDNTAYTWTAAVQETVDATLNRTVSSGEGGRGAAGRGLVGVCSYHTLRARCCVSRALRVASARAFESARARLRARPPSPLADPARDPPNAPPHPPPPKKGISGASYYEGSFSNVARSSRGDYVAVSSRGNFYMTWTPGQAYWQPHNRPAARRVQNMGFNASGDALWMSTRGGDVYLSSDAEGNGFETTKLSSRGFGVLDVG